jgi:hypothetical protein
MNSLILRRSGIMPCQGDIDVRLIEKNAIARIHLTHFLLMEAMLFLDVFAVTLCRVISLFSV